VALTKNSRNQFFEISIMERLMGYFVEFLSENWLKWNGYQLIRIWSKISQSERPRGYQNNGISKYLSLKLTASKKLNWSFKTSKNNFQWFLNLRIDQRFSSAKVVHSQLLKNKIDDPHQKIDLNQKTNMTTWFRTRNSIFWYSLLAKIKNFANFVKLAL